jgi:hypothetical protein
VRIACNPGIPVPGNPDNFLVPESWETKDETSIVIKEFANFEVEGKRGAKLESCYENFNSVSPSSVELERVFEDVEELLP